VHVRSFHLVSLYENGELNFSGGADWEEDGHQYRVLPPSALQGEGGSGGIQMCPCLVCHPSHVKGS
jgi:hypothetical protein